MRYNLGESDNVIANTIYQPVLRWALPFLSEKRKDSDSQEPYIRPMSMKMCPPNYFLHGLEVNYKDTGDARHELYGVNQLICINQNDDILYTPLKPHEDPSTTHAWTYKFHGRLFSVEQRIGQNVANQNGLKSTPLTCNGNKIVAGFQYTKTEVGPIKDFWLECIDRP